MNLEILKELIKSKEGITLVGVITLLLVIVIINVAVKDTQAYYSSVTLTVSKKGFRPRALARKPLEGLEAIYCR